jgi:hypothetical protein
MVANLEKISTPITCVPTHGMRVLQNTQITSTGIKFRYFMQQHLLGNDGNDYWRNVEMFEVEADDPRWIDAMAQDE